MIALKPTFFREKDGSTIQLGDQLNFSNCSKLRPFSKYAVQGLWEELLASLRAGGGCKQAGLAASDLTDEGRRLERPDGGLRERLSQCCTCVGDGAGHGGTDGGTESA